MIFHDSDFKIWQLCWWGQIDNAITVRAKRCLFPTLSVSLFTLFVQDHFHFFCPRPPPLIKRRQREQWAIKPWWQQAATPQSTLLFCQCCSPFLGENCQYQVPINVDNSCSFGFVFQFQRKTAWLNYEFRALCSLLKSRKVIQRKVKKVKLIPHLHFPFYQMSNPGPIIVLPCYLQYPANKLSSLRARCKLISAAPDLWTFLSLLQLLVFEEQPNLCEGCTSCSVWAKVHL